MHSLNTYTYILHIYTYIQINSIIYFLIIVCPNIPGGSICKDIIFLRLCNSLRLMGRSLPRSCQATADEYTDVTYPDAIIIP